MWCASIHVWLDVLSLAHLPLIVHRWLSSGDDRFPTATFITAAMLAPFPPPSLLPAPNAVSSWMRPLTYVNLNPLRRLEHEHVRLCSCPEGGWWRQNDRVPRGQSGHQRECSRAQLDPRRSLWVVTVIIISVVVAGVKVESLPKPWRMG